MSTQRTSIHGIHYAQRESAYLEYSRLARMCRWDADLLSSINSNTNLNFVIINPDSGPGNDSYPASDFVAGIQRLNSHAIVQIVGYVRRLLCTNIVSQVSCADRYLGTGYGNKSISDIARDVETYAGWSNNDSSLATHGIFFDEAAYVCSARNLLQLVAIDQYAKNSTGIFSL